MRNVDDGSVTFGRNLRWLRRRFGMSLNELARESGLTGACISNVENGKRQPNLSTILKIMKVIPVKFEIFIAEGK